MRGEDGAAGNADGATDDGTGDTRREASTGRSSATSRRSLLRRGVAVAATGLAGCSLAPGGGTGGDDGPTASPREWEPTTPRLASEWFDDVTPESVWDSYPRPQLRRDRWQSLNGEWGFRSGSIGEAPPVGDSLGECVLVPFPVESALSGVGRREQLVWYRTTFTVPDGWAIGEGERLLVHFEAVDRFATVYCNGEEVGRHEGGYDHFAFDLTPHLGDGEQELLVRVVDSTDTSYPLGKQRRDPRGIFYTPTTGIWQSVWLEPVPDPSIEGLDLTPALSEETFAVTVDLAARGDSATAEATTEGTLTVRVTASADGTEVGTVTGPPGTELDLPVSETRPWSPEDPFLYDLSVELRHRGGGVVDSVESYAGLRSVGIERADGAPRLTLNGKPRFRIGTLDQGYWPGGAYTPPTEEAMTFDLQVHVDLGFDTVRKHIKVEPRRWYYHADRLGLLVWQDMPSTFAAGERGRAAFRRELRAMVEQLGNHPCIEMWVPFNEGWGAHDVDATAKAVASWDSGRLVNRMSGYDVCGCPGPGGDVAAVHNYVGPGPAPDDDDRAAVVDEFGGIGLAITGHLWNPAREYSYASASSRADLTESYVRLTEELRRLAIKEDIAGGIWTQLTDVEREINGLYTYDRTVEKVDRDRVREANRTLRRVFDVPREAVGAGVPGGRGD